MAEIISKDDIETYIAGALAFPLKDKYQLLSMVILHFNIPDQKAKALIDECLNDLKVQYQEGIKRIDGINRE